MLDIKLIRENPQDFDTALAKRGIDPRSTTILALDTKNRELLTNTQELQNQRNQIAKSIGIKKQQKQDTTELNKLSSELKQQIAQVEQKLTQINQELTELLVTLPNQPLPEVPQGKDEQDNQTIKTWGEIPQYNFSPQRHFDIGENLGLMDFTTASKISGARFVILKGDLAKLERAIANFMLDIHTKEFGYVETSPPILVLDNAMYGAGLLPKFADNAFQTTEKHWLIPTAEVPLSNMYADTILEEQQLPIRHVAHTPCFRSEAGAAGKDTRGMIRLHQFTKVELVSITSPEHSAQEHEGMTRCAETILEKLQLPYRRMLLCTGDMGVQSAKTYDLEVWLPGENTYREISSCSVCCDYQARRMKTRYKKTTQDNRKSKPELVHTLNGSGLAVGRTIVAILENYQQQDGSILIPQVLQPYMDGQEKIEHSC